MRKQIAKRAISLLTALALVLGTVFVTAGQAEAASKPPAKIVDQTLWAGDYAWVQVEFKNWKNYDKAKLVSVKSSNKAVLKAEKRGSSIGDVGFESKKPGKSKVTVTYKLKGKKYTIRNVYTVKKYPKPLKSFTINGKKINLNKNKYNYYKHDYKKSTIKIKIVPAKGWKIKHLFVYTFDSKDNDKEINVTKKQLKNGKRFKFKKGDKELYINMYLINNKGETINYMVDIYR